MSDFSIVFAPRPRVVWGGGADLILIAGFRRHALACISCSSCVYVVGAPSHRAWTTVNFNIKLIYYELCSSTPSL